MATGGGGNPNHDEKGRFASGSHSAGVQSVGIKAFHGSPYNFNEFDAAKIGTGEGSSMMGRGVYLAEEPKVASTYVSSHPVATVDGKAVPIPFWESMQHTPAQYAAKALWSVGDKPAALDRLYQAQKYPQGAAAKEFPNAKVAKAAYDLIDKGKATLNEQGLLYEARINAPPEHLLDLDKKLSEQSPYVRNALNNKMRQSTNSRRYMATDPTGSDFVNETRIPEQEFANAGIPGAKYLDQGSRKTGQGTRNYVVFDTKVLKIVNKTPITKPRS